MTDKSSSILVMGLPGAGKSTFAQHLYELLVPEISTTWLCADAVRALADDWDFTPSGRLRQARRMKGLADRALDEGSTVVILDFVCPLPSHRSIVAPTHLVFLDTITQGRFQDTNALFVPPTPAEMPQASYTRIKTAAQSYSHAAKLRATFMLNCK